jgi:hypothetical protein
MQHDRHAAELAGLELVADELERTVVLGISDRMNHLLVPRVSDLDDLALFLFLAPSEEVTNAFERRSA